MESMQGQMVLLIYYTACQTGGTNELALNFMQTSKCTVPGIFGIGDDQGFGLLGTIINPGEERSVSVW